jgi:hypothetical protein
MQKDEGVDRTCFKHRRSSLSVLSAAAGTVMALTVPGFAGTASAADRAAAQANSRWLAARLGADGTLQNPLGGTLPDHGLMIDTLFALHASGEGPLADPIVRYLDDERHATDYYTWDGLVPGQGYDAVIVGGATAKVLVAAEVAGRDPRSFGGHDMVAETKGTIMRSGPDKGRVSDYSKNPDLSSSVINNANMFGQALAVIGLAGAGENDQLAIDTMLTQQCSEGYFRIFFGYVPTTETGDDVTPNGNRLSTCDEGKAYDQSAPDGDATGLALSAMVAARRAGAAGLDGPIGKTVSWLKAHQASGGGWGGGVSTEAPNTNSTGLIVQALADAGGAAEAVDKGTAYLKSAQVGSGDSGGPLGGQLGAIAYTPEQYQDARTNGISGIDTWIRAGAQASLGLSQVGFYDLTKGKVPGDDGGGDGDGPGGSPSPSPSPTPSGTPSPTPTTSKPGRSGLPPPRPRPGASTAPTQKAQPVSSRAGDKAPPPGSSGGTTVTPATSQAQPVGTSPSAPARLGAYLAGKLVDGDHIEVSEGGKTYVDYDATADLVFALRALNEQPLAVTRASRFLLDRASIAAYAHGAPYEKQAAYAEPLAKLQIIARFMQPDPAAPTDLPATIETLRSDLAGLRSGEGRFTDRGSYGDSDASVRRQAWIVLATTAGAAPGEAAVPLDVLLTGQCSDGTFPAKLGGSRCASGDLPSTAAAVTALNAQPPSTPPAAANAANITGTATGGATARIRSAAQTDTSGTAVPAGWTKQRLTALTKAVTALSAKADGHGVVKTANGTIDPVLSASVATARQVSGLDATATAQALGALLRPDGGLAKPPGQNTDLPTSVAAAPGVAGRSWMNASGSPVTVAVRLPGSTTASSGKGGSGGHPLLWSLPVGAAVASAGLVYGLHRRRTFRKPRPSLSSRSTSPKGKTT